KIGEESPRFFKERPAGLCQSHAPLQSLKERVSHLFFKLPYLARQSRLRHAQSLGRPPEMLFFPNGDEVTKVSQFHKNSNSEKLSVWRNQSIGRYHLSRATFDIGILVWPIPPYRKMPRRNSPMLDPVRDFIDSSPSARIGSSTLRFAACGLRGGEALRI